MNTRCSFIFTFVQLLDLDPAAAGIVPRKAIPLVPNTLLAGIQKRGLTTTSNETKNCS